MICSKCRMSNNWIAKRTITHIDVEKDENYLICKCGNIQDVVEVADVQ